MSASMGRNRAEAQAAAVRRVMRSNGDPYRILGLAAVTTDRSVLKKARRHWALFLHPDKNPDPQAAEAMKLLNQAFDVLMTLPPGQLWRAPHQTEPTKARPTGGASQKQQGKAKHNDPQQAKERQRQKDQRRQKDQEQRQDQKQRQQKQQKQKQKQLQEEEHEAYLRQQERQRRCQQEDWMRQERARFEWHLLERQRKEAADCEQRRRTISTITKTMVATVLAVAAAKSMLPDLLQW